VDQISGISNVAATGGLSSDQANFAANNELPASDNVAVLMAELKATCDRLFATLEASPMPGGQAAPEDAAIQSTQLRATPDAAALKRMLRFRTNRRRRTSLSEFFDWPTWDMLLDLAAERAEGSHVSVSSVCISSGAPQSTALRKLAALESAKLVERYFHGKDRRRVCIRLTEQAAEMVASALRDELAVYHSLVPAR
jgi:DNA-binding transcriptional ArsR family regulator